MPTHDTTLDLMISQLIASLHAARSLELPGVESAIRDTLIALGRSIAADTPQPAPRKTGRTTLPRPVDPDAAVMDLSRVVDMVAPTMRAMPPEGLGRTPLPRRRLASRRIGSRD